LVKK